MSSTIKLFTPAPIRAPISDDPSLLTARIWSAWFTSVAEQLSGVGQSQLYLTTPGFSAADFTALAGGTWTVTSPAVRSFSTRLSGDTLQVNLKISHNANKSAYVTGASVKFLQIALPQRSEGPYLISEESQAPCLIYDNSNTPVLGIADTAPGFNTISFQRADGAFLADSSGVGALGTGVTVQMQCYVKQP